MSDPPITLNSYFHKLITPNSFKNIQIFLFNRFGDEDFEEFYRLKANFHSSDNLHEDAAARHARISKKKINEKVKR